MSPGNKTNAINKKKNTNFFSLCQECGSDFYPQELKEKRKCRKSRKVE